MDARLTTEQLEHRIVECLQKGILQPTDIAKAIDPAANSTAVVRVYRRLQALQKRGVIMGYYARLNLEKIGYPRTLVAQIALHKPLTKDAVIAFERYIGQHQQLIGLHLIDDVPTDYVAIFAITAERDYKAMGKWIERCTHVKHVTTARVLRTVHLPASPPIVRLAS